MSKVKPSRRGKYFLKETKRIEKNRQDQQNQRVALEKVS